jgi:heme-degrading monooxygenase HmoA
MVKHIVVWKLKESAHGRSKEENAHAIKAKLEGLVGIVPGLLHAEVGLDFRGSSESADAGLYSEFESREAFEAFLTHPAHKEVHPFVKEARSERLMLDYEV